MGTKLTFFSIILFLVSCGHEPKKADSQPTTVEEYAVMPMEVQQADSTKSDTLSLNKEVKNVSTGQAPPTLTTMAILTERPWQRKTDRQVNLECRWEWTTTRMMMTMKMALMMDMMNNSSFFPVYAKRFRRGCVTLWPIYSHYQ